MVSLQRRLYLPGRPDDAADHRGDQRTRLTTANQAPRNGFMLLRGAIAQHREGRSMTLNKFTGCVGLGRAACPRRLRDKAGNEAAPTTEAAKDAAGEATIADGSRRRGQVHGRCQGCRARRHAGRSRALYRAGAERRGVRQASGRRARHADEARSADRADRRSHLPYPAGRDPRRRTSARRSMPAGARRCSRPWAAER